MQILLTLLLSISALSAVLVRGIEVKNRSETLEIKKINLDLKQDHIVLRELPLFLPEGAPPSEEIYHEVVYKDESKFTIPKVNFRETAIPGSEVRTIVEQGPQENRINLAFLGDGYTEAEREKFFEDVQRMTYDLFGEATFASYLPLFNVYAIFTPSRDSGITDILRKDTVFGLYRSPKGSKRGIMPGDRWMLEKAIRQIGVHIHYPIVVANDDFYGGLGGRYAITTRSLESGSMVLRHELGHNFGNVGEEYDGGYVYQGANASHSHEKWEHWIDSDFVYSEALHLMGDYVWQNLGKTYQKNFQIKNKYKSLGPFTFDISLSTVGWSSPEEVTLKVNGYELPYEGLFTPDRSFFDVLGITGLGMEKHTLTVEQNINDGDNVLAFARVYAYPANYDFTPNKVAAFASYDINLRKSYRPTHDMCLMRNMRSPHFCPVDQENMWKRFLQSVDLIDAVTINENIVQLQGPQLPMVIKWYRATTEKYEEITELQNQVEWDRTNYPAGNYLVQVQFITEEVRDYSDDFVDMFEFEL